jgi:hypothetical protein
VAQFRFPGGDSRTTVIGATGSGKTTCGVWLLAHQRLDKRPWIIVDFKREGIFDVVGLPPIQSITLTSRPPRKPGLYLVSPRPDEDEILEAWLWRVWERENTGLFIDEASLMPDKDAFRAILQQGRSKCIPTIACTQRPVDVKRALFSEASYFCVYRMQDVRDYKTVQQRQTQYGTSAAAARRRRSVARQAANDILAVLLGVASAWAGSAACLSLKSPAPSPLSCRWHVPA